MARNPLDETRGRYSLKRRGERISANCSGPKPDNSMAGRSFLYRSAILAISLC